VLPQSLAGLLLLAASICPGYWWIRVLEERKARRDRSQLLEAAELLSIGGLFSSLAFLIALVIVDRTHLIDSAALIRNAHRYTEHHAIRVALALLMTLVGANVTAWLVAKRVYRGHSQIVHESALHLAVSQSPTDSRALVTAVLNDGTAITGWFNACTAEPSSPEKQELVLARLEDAPDTDGDLKIRLPRDRHFQPLKDHCVVLNGAQVASTYVRFVRVLRPSAD
jgi:hypothetical protein